MFSHFRILTGTPSPKFRVEDAVPTLYAKLMQKSARAALANGISNSAEFAAGGTMIDARMWRIGVSEWIKAALKGMCFEMSLRRYCLVVRISKDDVGCRHIRLPVQRRITRESRAAMTDPKDIPLGCIAIRAIEVVTWVVWSAVQG